MKSLKDVWSANELVNNLGINKESETYGSEVLNEGQKTKGL